MCQNKPPIIFNLISASTLYLLQVEHNFTLKKSDSTLTKLLIEEKVFNIRTLYYHDTVFHKVSFVINYHNAYLLSIFNI